MKKLLLILMMISAATFGRTESKPETGKIIPVKEHVFSKKYTMASQPVSLNQLPKAARQFMKENYPIRKITYISKINKNEAKYEVGINLEGKINIVQFDSKGELVEEKVVKK